VTARTATAGFVAEGIVLSTQQIVALHAVVIAAILAPMLIAAHPPLIDYPNHLARIHVLATIGSDPMLQEKYLAHWSLLPNLAMDALLVPLARVVPIYLLGKLFVIVTMLFFIGGAYALRWVLRRNLSVWQAAILLVVYNHVFAWGFLNYLFGAGLALFALSTWIWTRERWSWRLRLPVFALVALALFFAHMFALGIYALAVGGFEFGREIRSWRARQPAAHFGEWALGAATFFAPAVLWHLTAVGAGDGVVLYGGHKFSAWSSMVMFHFQGLGVVTFLFVVALLVGGLATRSFRLDGRMAVPLVVLLIAMIAMPSWLFGSWGADFRIPPVLCAIAVASTQFERRRRMLTDVFLIVGAAMIAMRVVTMVGIVRKHDAQVAELRSAFAQVIPRGTRLLAARNFPHGDERKKVFWRIYHHVAAYAVIDRSIYLPSLFTDREKQPLLVTQRYRYMTTPSGNPVPDHGLRRGADRVWSGRMFARPDPRGRNYYWTYWPDFYDYVVVFRLEDRTNPVPRHLKIVKAGSYFDIYKVVRGRP